MAAKIERTAFDRAAEESIENMIENTGLSLRAMAAKLGGAISHNRIATIINGERGPVRLSEFILICQACNQDPAVILRQILQLADEIEHNAIPIDPANLDPTNPEHIQYIADHHGEFDYAAKRGDTEAEQEAYEELP